MAHTHTCLLTHLIFSTKYRLPLLDDRIRGRVFAYMNGIIQEIGGKTIIIDGRPDHAHVLASLPARLAISDAMRTVKANSSRWITEEGLLPDFAWQTGYGAFSIGRSERDTVIDYIKDQLAHHRTVTYQDEYLRLLHEYDVDYDPRFLWD